MRILAIVLAMALAAGAAGAQEMKHDHGAMGHMMGGQGAAADTRIKLDAPDMMKERQKLMMREHLRATQKVMALMAQDKWDEASALAHAQLGLTEEMRQMCSMFGPAFNAMGLAFHESGDRLGDALKAKDRGKSETAMADMLGKCVACHDTFKQ